MTNEVEVGSNSQTGTGGAGSGQVGYGANAGMGQVGAGSGVTGVGAQAGQAGVGAGTTNVSRDDIESIVNSAMQAASRAFQQTENVIDVGSDEAQMRAIVNDSHKWSANDKRTYDEYQDLALNHARRNAEYENRSRDHYDMMQGDNRAYIANLRKIELELLQNGNTAAKVGDASLWTVDKEALEAAVAVAVANALQGKA